MKQSFFDWLALAVGMKHSHKWAATRHNPWGLATERKCQCGATQHLWEVEDYPIGGVAKWRDGPHPYSSRDSKVVA